MPEVKKTLVIGASDNPQRYSFMAVSQLRKMGHPVVAVGARNTIVGDVPITTEKTAFPEVDTVTLYLSPRLQQQYYDYILSQHPKRVIFNPGTENPELEGLLKKQGIQPLVACTLVLLSTGQF